MTDADALLLNRASDGDRQAVDQLLDLHRGRLRRMISLRIDGRLAGRIDPSDVVQEALAEAWRQLPQYLKRKRSKIPFYPWLRQIAWERLIQQHRRHLGAQARDAGREQALGLSQAAANQLAIAVSCAGTSPSMQAVRNEVKQRVQQMLLEMTEQDREVLILRFLEQLSLADTAAVLGLTSEGARTRQRRALHRLSRMMEGEVNS